MAPLGGAVSVSGAFCCCQSVSRPPRGAAPRETTGLGSGLWWAEESTLSIAFGREPDGRLRALGLWVSTRPNGDGTGEQVPGDASRYGHGSRAGVTACGIQPGEQSPAVDAGRFGFGRAVILRSDGGR